MGHSPQASSGRARTILVTDGEQRAALATVRSLGRAGHRVEIVSSRAASLAAASRHSRREWILPDSLREPDGFRDRLEAVARSTRADVILPMSEAALLAILPHRAAFDALIPFPSDDAFRRICDKALVLSLAGHHGIQVPQQQVVMTKADEGAALGSARFPLVVKPTRSVSGTGRDLMKTSVLYATDAASLRDALASLPAAAFPVLLQERVEGPGFAISVLRWEGELRAAFAHHRLREKPPSGGVSVLREAIALDPDLLARSMALLAEFDWAGVAMVEFKMQARTGVPYLMEINGRLWGSLQLAIDSGVDFPDLLLRAALGERYEPVTSYAVGTRTQWEWGDVDHLLAMVRHSRARLALPPSAPGAVHALRDVAATFASRTRAEVFRWNDPMPFVRESIDWMRRR